MYEWHVHMKMYPNLCICMYLCVCLPDACYSPLREQEEDNEMADFLQTKFPNRCSKKSMYVCVTVVM